MSASPSPESFLRSLHVVDDPQAVARHAAESLVSRVDATRDRAARFSVALSGGSTPRLLFELLAGEFRDRLDLDRLEIFFGDERSVPPDHPDSNYRTACDLWLDRVDFPRDRLHRMEAESEDLDAAARRYQECIGERVRRGPGGLPDFDLIWLGMGEDGHTASLFPGTSALVEENRWVVGNEVPQLETHRLTLTFPVLDAASHVEFLVTGGGKAPILEQLARGEGGYPSGRVVPERGTLAWVVDRAAAARLPAND